MNATVMQYMEIGPAFLATAAGITPASYAAAGIAGGTGLTIPATEGRLCTFIINYHALGGTSPVLTRAGFTIQGSNNDPSGSMTWASVRPHPLVQSGRFASLSHQQLGICVGTGRTPPDSAPALTAEQAAIEARRLTRWAANGMILFTVDLERTGFLHHRLIVNELVMSGTSPTLIMSANYLKFNLRENVSSHPYETDKFTARPLGFTDAEWAQYLDDGTIPATVPQDSVLQLSQNRLPIRPGGLSNAQWDRLRNSIVEEGLFLQRRPEFT